MVVSKLNVVFFLARRGDLEEEEMEVRERKNKNSTKRISGKEDKGKER